MDVIEAIVLGIVQGLTEFLPISSSAHLIIVPWLFGWKDPGVEFDVALHLGTLTAVLAYFWSDWVRIVKALIQSILERRVGDDPDRRIAWYVVIGTIPGAVAGFLLESRINDLFHQASNLRTGLLVIGIMMLVMGAVLLLAERVGRHATDMRHLQFSQAMGVGLAQALALIPGVSRSGSTITAGLFFGLKREAAARFSFLLATPIILGAGAKSLYDVLKDQGGIPADMQLAFVAGFLTAAVVGFLCIFFLLRYLQRNSTAPFIWYRFMLGILLIGLVVIGFRQ